MAGVQQLVSGILQFLAEQQTSASLDEDAKESLEVAAQCLETAYGVSKETYPLPDSLPTVFQHGIKSCPQKPQTSSGPTVADTEEAERLKGQGNEMMKSEKFSEAINFYTQAIQKDPSKAVYFCNRAAAFSKLDKQTEAINDCDKALNIDPAYSKAYGRKGLALSSCGKHKEASECFKKALEFDPDNESYKNNLKLAEQKAREECGAPMGDGAGMGGMNMGGFNLSAMLNNPALMNMASSMMSNPQMQHMMANLMSGSGGQPGGTQGLESLMQVGQQFAEEMRSSNPELVEQLRQQVNQSQNPPQDPGAGNS